MDHDPEIELDPETGARSARERDRRYNVVQVPLLRCFGFALLYLLVMVHNALVFGHVDRAELSKLALVFALYSAASWLLLARSRSTSPTLRLVALGTSARIAGDLPEQDCSSPARIRPQVTLQKGVAHE